MRKLWILAVGFISLVAVSCGDSPRDVVVGAEADSTQADTSDDGAQNDGAATSGEAWIDPRDAMISEAGGRWAQSDFGLDNPPVGAFSAPIEMTLLTTEELESCVLLDTIFWPESPNDVNATAYHDDGSELEHTVLDRGTDASRIAAALSDFPERCTEWDEEGFIIKALDVDVNSVVFELESSMEDGPNDDFVNAWVSVASRQNVLSFVALVGQPGTTSRDADLAEFERLVGLQLDALASAPVSRIDGRVPDLRPTDEAGDASSIDEESSVDD